MAGSDNKAIDRLVSDLRTAHGDNLASITLCHSSTGDSGEPSSDVLVVLKRIELSDLQRCRPSVSEWQKGRRNPPIFFTLDELQRASDVFPIEFLQMEKARKILYGSDPFQFVEISRANLRRQTEYELRTKFIQLRRLYVSQTPSGASVSALMVDSFPTFAALFRAVLTLLNEEAPASNSESVRRTIALLALDRTPFEWIIKNRQQATAASEDEINGVFAAYLDQLARVIDAVDHIE